MVIITALSGFTRTHITISSGLHGLCVQPEHILIEHVKFVTFTTKVNNKMALLSSRNAAWMIEILSNRERLFRSC